MSKPAFRNMSYLFSLFVGGLVVGLTSISPVFAVGGVDQAPAPAEKHVSQFARPQETKLANGLRVMIAERRDLPLLTAQLVVRYGAEIDPAGFSGAASLTAALLSKGTDKMSAPQIADAIESLGGSIESAAGWDASGATVTVMSDKADAALQILSDVVRHPAFQQEEIDRLKSQRLDGLRVSLQQPGSLARFVTSRVVFGAGAYGHAASGTIESLQAISRADVVRLYQTYYRPTTAALLFAGNLNLEEGRAYAEKYFGDWKSSEPAPNESKSPVTPGWKAQSVVVDMPEAGQAAVTVARPLIARASPEYYAALVTNAALGNGFVSRLNREIRIKRGLSYGAGSALDARREAGPFAASAQTKNESAAEVAGLMKSELQRLVTDPVKGEELKSRQAVLTGEYARALETNHGFVEQMSELAAYDLPLDTLDKFIPAIDGVTSDAVTAFARKYLAQPVSLIIVGKAAAFSEALQKSGITARTIEQKNLDLNQASLTKTK